MDLEFFLALRHVFCLFALPLVLFSLWFVIRVRI